MPRFQLRIYVEPGAAEIFCKVLRKDKNYERLSAIIDTGAAISLFPQDLLEFVEFSINQPAPILIDQAGIASQSFEAFAATIQLTLEDETGLTTEPFQIRAWFANIDHVLIGFADLLDQAVLHIDMSNREGWLEIDR